MRIPKLLSEIVLCLFLCGLPLGAQETQPLPSPPSDSHITRGNPARDLWSVATRFPRDQADIFTVPVKLPRQKRAVAYVLPFAAAAAFIPFDRHIESNLPRGHGGASETISNAGIEALAGSAGVFYAVGWFAHSDRARETGILGAAAFVDSVLPHAAINLIAGRDRPYQGVGEDRYEGEFFAQHKLSTSFPSDHAMYNFALASVMAHEYPSKKSKVLWYGLATMVTISRVTARQHFPSDVIAGGTIGYLIGRHIFHAHCSDCATSRQP
jgi:membrane-associated phospholipid phosphatase